MEELRIAIIDPVGKKAGLDHYDLSLAMALERRSYIVKVYSNFEGSPKSMIRNKFKFTFKKGFLRSIVIFSEFISALSDAKKLKVNIVILHLFHSSLVDLLFSRLTKIFGFRICMIVHDIESFIGQGNGSLIDKIIRYSDHIIVHNEFAYDELIFKIRKNDVKKVSIIPHGNFITLHKETVREEALRYFELDPSAKYLLFFGMIKETKGLDVLINAMTDIPSGVHLIIAGRTRDLPFCHYESLINKLDLSGRVHSYIRYITNDERNLLFCAADIVVLPYRKIYQSGVMILSMSYRKPVVASDLEANKTIINGSNGILFKANDSADLSLQIGKLLNDKERMRAISTEAMEYVSISHDWDKIADSFVNIIN